MTYAKSITDAAVVRPRLQVQELNQRNTALSSERYLLRKHLMDIAAEVESYAVDDSIKWEDVQRYLLSISHEVYEKYIKYEGVTDETY